MGCQVAGQEAGWPGGRVAGWLGGRPVRNCDYIAKLQLKLSLAIFWATYIVVSPCIIILIPSDVNCIIPQRLSALVV